MYKKIRESKNVEQKLAESFEKYCDANPSDYCEVLHYHADSGWQVSEEYDGFYD